MVVEREYWQLLGEDDRGAARFGSALGQENPELGEQPANAIDGCGAFLDVALAHAMQREDGLLLGALDGNEAHVGPGAAFAGGLGIVTIVPGALATGRNEAGHHDSDSMAMSLELPCPFAGTATGRHADESWRQGGDELHLLVSPNRLAQDGAATGIDAMQGEHRLCEIEPYGSNLVHDFPSGFRLNIDISILAPRCRRGDGEVPVVRWARGNWK